MCPTYRVQHLYEEVAVPTAATSLNYFARKSSSYSVIVINRYKRLSWHLQEHQSQVVASTMDRLQHGPLTRIHRKPAPHFMCFFSWNKTIGAMMLPFGCNGSQPIPNILAHNFFSKKCQVKLWPDNENFVFVKKIIDYLSLEGRSQQNWTMLMSIPTYFCPNCFIFRIFEAIQARGLPEVAIFRFLEKTNRCYHHFTVISRKNDFKTQANLHFWK